jgi:ParB family chromosome partitioning protein
MEALGTVRGTEGTGEFERWTPARYMAPVRAVLGEIDLDPASTADVQRTVQARRFFTERDDGLAQPWHGRVFLNPPYHRKLLPAFITKLVAETECGNTSAAILLTNNCTDTDWFTTAGRAAASVCFTYGRIEFEQPSGGLLQPTQGQAFIYFGAEPDRFEEIFCRIGHCWRPSRHYRPNLSDNSGGSNE